MYFQRRNVASTSQKNKARSLLSSGYNPILDPHNVCYRCADRVGPSKLPWIDELPREAQLAAWRSGQMQTVLRIKNPSIVIGRRKIKFGDLS